MYNSNRSEQGTGWNSTNCLLSCIPCSSHQMAIWHCMGSWFSSQWQGAENLQDRPLYSDIFPHPHSYSIINCLCLFISNRYMGSKQQCGSGSVIFAACLHMVHLSIHHLHGSDTCSTLGLSKCPEVFWVTHEHQRYSSQMPEVRLAWQCSILPQI